MSIDHKAWLFDSSRFELEIAQSLYRALSENSVAPLRKANLIRQDFDDVHEAGEAAISTLLSTDQNYGLSYGFDFLWRGMLAVPAVAEHAEELICGRLFGPPERRFDPGRMGTGFISKQRVQFFSELLSTLGPSSLPPASSHWYAECLYRPASDEDLARVLAALTHGFSVARQRGLGLLLVDFRE